MYRIRCWLAFLMVATLAQPGCRTAGAPRPPGEVRYVGSSTVAIYLRDAEPVYGALRFQIDDAPESEGGLRAILAGETDLAGYADRPDLQALGTARISAELLGRDAIAVIVHHANPVRGLSGDALRSAFTGRVQNWRELGGPDLAITPLVVGEESATHRVFRATVLGGQAYSGCTTVRPDRDIVQRVADTPGGIGQISFSFLEGAVGVRALQIDGQPPTTANFDYPIARPLYLLWREGRPEIDAFVEWTRSGEGQMVVLRHFVGTNVSGSVRGVPVAQDGAGTLVVHTETYPVYDGGITYYPHRPYEILTRKGELVRRVANHRGENDESPTRVRLAPGTYLVRAQGGGGARPEFLVTIEAGRLTELRVEEVQRRRQ